MWRLRFAKNWLYWAFVTRSIPPKGVGYIAGPQPPLTPEEIAMAQELAREHGLLAEGGTQ